MPECNLQILPQNITLKVHFEVDTTVKEFFEYIQIEYNLQNHVSQWICKNPQTNSYLSLNDRIPLDTTNLIIQTTISAEPQTQNQFSQQQQQPSQKFQPNIPLQQENITINIVIQDGNHKRCFQTHFNSLNTLEQVATTALVFCGLNDKVAAADLELYGQAYNDHIKRSKTLQQLSLKSGVEVQARIRWIGG